MVLFCNITKRWIVYIYVLRFCCLLVKADLSVHEASIKYGRRPRNFSIKAPSKSMLTILTFPSFMKASSRPTLRQTFFRCFQESTLITSLWKCYVWIYLARKILRPFRCMLETLRQGSYHQIFCGIFLYNGLKNDELLWCVVEPIQCWS